MKNFAEAMKYDTNFTTTTNGAVALKSTNSSLLDFFAQAGAIRGRNAKNVEEMFFKAYHEDPLLAMKSLFYTRDVRGGLGERMVFRTILSYMAKNHPDTVLKNLAIIPFFGRWDDLFLMFNTPCEGAMIDFVSAQLAQDTKDAKAGKPISLLGKWMPSENASSANTVAMAVKFVKAFGMTPKTYRKMLTFLRGVIKITEAFMSANNWNEVDYPAVPSKAMTNYRKAFSKHDADRFVGYLESLKKGETKINAATLYPYDIIEKAGLNMPYNGNLQLSSLDDVLQAQWDAQTNYVEGENNILVMADTSGSMRGRPMSTSVGLAIYFAERNKGVFKDLFMTFSSKPSLVELKGNNLAEKVRCVPSIVSNTNLEAAFQLILDVAVRNNIPASEMPKALAVISDMQFDSATAPDYRDSRRPAPFKTFHSVMEEKFLKAGYEMPSIVYWNVNSLQDTHQVDADKPGVQLYSGQSPSTFRSVVQNIGKTPYEAMISVLGADRYNAVRV